MSLNAEQFESELAAAQKSFDRHIVCLEKTPEEGGDAIRRLLKKAIAAYESRAEGLRHGIALDRHVTIILSQTEGDRPLCGVYFNLHSPYAQK
jgi:hypothetical protein